MEWKKYGAVGLAVLAFAGVSMGAESCSESIEDLEDVAGENDHPYRAKIRKVQIGMHKPQVLAIMGKPRDRQIMQTAGMKSEYLDYGSWQLTFTDGVLDSKNKY